MTTVKPEPIKHHSNPQLVRVRIELASAVMLIRDYTMNAIEATPHLDVDEVDIWFETQIRRQSTLRPRKLKSKDRF